MKKNELLTISPENKNKRLDRFLLENFPQYSRNFWQKNIKNGLTLVNEKKVLPHHFLKINDKVEIAWEKMEIVAKEKQEIKPIEFALEILKDEHDYLILNKPAGMLMHPAQDKTKPSLANYLLAKYPQIKDVGDPATAGWRPGIVHRLDQEASGLLLIAKNQLAFEYFKKCFQNRQIEKKYLVLVYGNITDKHGLILSPIGRSDKSIKMKIEGKDAKEASTEFETLEHFYDPILKQEYTLLEVKIHTGRTHQIRIHFKSIYHAVVGDILYQPKRTKRPKQLSRIFLHCFYLGFKDLANEQQEFKIDLAPELKDFLEKFHPVK